MIGIRTAGSLSAALLLALTGCGDADEPEVAANATTNNVANAATSPEQTTPNGTTPDETTPNNVETCDQVAVTLETIGAAEAPANATIDASELQSGGWEATLDASLGGPAAAAESAWVYLDLDSAELLPIDDLTALEDDRWELAFKRAEIRLNSGDSGPRSLLLASSEGTWDDAPAPDRNATWVDDDFVDDSCEVETYGRGSAATAFSDWYDYDPATHAVSAPENVVYFTYDPATHAVTKIQITGYDSGVYQLRWAPVGAS